MAKIVRYLRDTQKEFQRIFLPLCERKKKWQVWSDFIECSAIALSNSLDQSGEVHDKREQRYLKIINTYNNAEQEHIAEMMACAADALEREPEQDFLGEMFMALEVNNHWRGQFFTPYHVGKLMAQMQTAPAGEIVERRGWIGINDPACGAGCLLIAARNEFARQKIGYRQALFVAQDVDLVAALMCYIQLSMLGCAGYVIVADTLRYPFMALNDSPLLPIFRPEQGAWFTPMFYDMVWQERIKWAKMDLILRGSPVKKSEKAPEAALTKNGKDKEKISMIVSKTPELVHFEENLITEKSGQLKLF